MWRSAELTKDYKEGEKSLQLRLEDETVSVACGSGSPGVTLWLECFLPVGASKTLTSSLLLLLITHVKVLNHEAAV